MGGVFSPAGIGHVGGDEDATFRGSAEHFVDLNEEEARERIDDRRIKTQGTHGLTLWGQRWLNVQEPQTLPGFGGKAVVSHPSALLVWSSMKRVSA